MSMLKSGVCAVCAVALILVGCDKKSEQESAELKRLQLENKKLQSEQDQRQQSEQKMQEEVAQTLADTRKAVSTSVAATKEKIKGAYAARTASLGEAEEVGGGAGTSSIKAEMRHGALGGYVLQVWNTTDKPLKCEATLNNPKLAKAPKYKFLLQPQAAKPQEIGAGQFGGRRILADPPCTVTVRVLGTNEEHTYQP